MTKSNPEDCAKYIRGPPEWIRSDSLFEGRTEKWIISDSLSHLAQMRPTWRRIPASHTDREVTYKTAVWHVCGAVGRHSRTAYYKRVKLTTHKITIIWDNVYIAIYYANKLCRNGGAAIFANQARSVQTIIRRIIELDSRGYDLSGIRKCSNTLEIKRIFSNDLSNVA